MASRRTAALLLIAALLVSEAWAAPPNKPGKPDKPGKPNKPKGCVSGGVTPGECYQCANKNMCRICWSVKGEQGYGWSNKARACVQCPPNCEKCQGNAQVCTRCLPSYGRKGKACVFCDPALHMVVNPRSQQCECDKANGYVKQGKVCVLKPPAA